MKAKQSFKELRNDFEIYRMFHLAACIIESAIIGLMIFMLYGCFYEILTGAGFFGTLLRLGLAYLFIKGTLWLIADFKRRLAVGKKKMQNYWQKMYPNTLPENVSDVVRGVAEKVSIFRRKTSVRRFQMYVMFACGMMLVGYAAFYFVLGLENGLNGADRIWLTQVISVALVFGTFGIAARVSWVKSVKKLREYASILNEFQA